MISNDLPEYTLGFIVDKNWENVLLWSKKKTNSGFTVSLWKRNGPWWKVELWETIEQWMIREIIEESEIEILESLLKKIWKIEFRFDWKPERDKHCTIFLIPGYDWPFMETEEMKRERKPINNLPREFMRKSDKQWLEKILKWEKIMAKVNHTIQGDVISIEFFNPDF